MTVPTFHLALVDRPHTRALGAIETDGYKLDVEFASFEEVRRGFLDEGRWDAAEFPLGRYIALKAAGDRNLTAIPVFPWRSFRHGAIYVRDDGSVSAPSDLERRRVGVTDWHQTAGIVARGLLANEYGVRLDRIDWVAAGLDAAPRPDPLPVPEPRGFAVQRSDTPLATLLQQGKIDAIIAADRPRGSGSRQLLADHSEAETAWFSRTGIFPVMHVIAIRRKSLSGRPTLDALHQLFEQAKASSSLAQEAKWNYGLDENRAALDRLLDDAFAQGIGETRLETEELFGPSVLP
ncbi:phosphate/phosphite/phosphonate ABC transporter substrate-binding protein [Ancylobacter sp. Lp-2]|uniref:phosphate/phosphite/phosphonate ABC transporter substrate-binding protein n=1 Tax=Ancylobacter sp. Lp-2 TaxID=2881339 RepID=UPI001E31B80B|nr:phosphate/phosphite/phosphonate ABC transporter substrate-binding protein [Ancylobacter sp. Lp-2]MCB4770439.1 phosphate/phosphite/phosphonate ABC transporter substrate-binding protein [Ancylobacter sp. Lp-2]